MRLIALLIALAAPAAAAHAQQGRAAAPADWTTRVVATAEGGYRMGNPAAAMKLVEYGSITCSHCADFETEQGAAIRAEIRTGRVSFEYRPYIIFPSDPGIFLLLSCQAPRRFFDSLHTLYETQGEWVARLEAKETEVQAAMQAGTFGTAIPAIVRATGTDAHFRRNGMTNARIASCLADRPRFERLSQVSRRGQELGVDGTPTFFLNGRKLEVATFADVVAALRQN